MMTRLETKCMFPSRLHYVAIMSVHFYKIVRDLLAQQLFINLTFIYAHIIFAYKLFLQKSHANFCNGKDTY